MQGPSPESAPATRPWGLYFSIAMLLLSCPLTVLAGLTATQSEERGVQLAYVAVGPVVFGVVGTIVGLLTRKKSTAIATGAPIGCGCLAALVAIVMTAVFFVAIFPSL